jgi:hypothetical protein
MPIKGKTFHNFLNSYAVPLTKSLAKCLIRIIKPVEFEISFYGCKAKDFDVLSTVYQIECVRYVAITNNCIKIEMKKFIAQVISE